MKQDDDEGMRSFVVMVVMREEWDLGESLDVYLLTEPLVAHVDDVLVDMFK